MTPQAPTTTPGEDVVRLREALAEALPIMEDCLQALGPCDHDVGICNCDMKRSIESMRSALAAAAPVVPQPTEGLRGTTADALKDALSHNLPLTTDQRAVLFTLVMEEGRASEKYDRDLAKLQAMVKEARAALSASPAPPQG